MPSAQVSELMCEMEWSREQLASMLAVTGLVTAETSCVLDLVVRDLNEPETRDNHTDSKTVAFVRFGARPVHTQLSVSQLYELVTRAPQLIQAEHRRVSPREERSTDTTFIVQLIRNSRPFDDPDKCSWESSRTQLATYLGQLEELCSKFGPRAATVQAHCRFHVLQTRLQCWPNSDVSFEPEKMGAYLLAPRRKQIGVVNTNVSNHLQAVDAFSGALKGVLATWNAATERKLVKQYLRHHFTRLTSSQIQQYLRRFFHQADTLSVEAKHLLKQQLLRNVSTQFHGWGLPEADGDSDWHHYFNWTASLSRPFVREVFATARLSNPSVHRGRNETKLLEALLPPLKLGRIKTRVQLRFHHNPARYVRGGPVQLHVRLQNVGNVTVNVYQVNTKNWYYKQMRELDGANLATDGLVASLSGILIFNITQPHHVVKHTVDLRALFPQATASRATLLVELLSGSVRSRALVRVGGITAVHKSTLDGHLFRLLDIDSWRGTRGSATISGHSYTSTGNDHHLVIPYKCSGLAASDTVVLTAAEDEFSALFRFNHKPEVYTLSAAFYVDSEALLAGRGGLVPLLIRARLHLHGVPVSMTQVSKSGWTLTVKVTDLEGVRTQQRTRFHLPDDAEGMHVFTLPKDTRSVSFQISSRIVLRNPLCDKPKQAVSASQTYTIGADADSQRLEGFYITTSNETDVHVLGRTGESVPDRVVQVELQPTVFSLPTTLTMQTDPQGRIRLGALAGIESIIVRSNQSYDNFATPVFWVVDPTLYTSNRVKSHSAHEGKSFIFPYVQQVHDGQLNLEEVFLWEVNAAQQSRALMRAVNVSEHIHLELVSPSGLPPAYNLVISGLVSGAYSLVLRQQGITYSLKVLPLSAPTVLEGVAWSEDTGFFRQLTWPDSSSQSGPLRICSVDASKSTTVDVILAGCSNRTRVHVLATHFAPRTGITSLANSMNVKPPAEPRNSWHSTVHNSFLEQRRLSDDHEYIISRQAAGAQIGNMLPQPSLLVNPHAKGTSAHVANDDEKAHRRGEAFRGDANATQAGTVSDGSGRGSHHVNLPEVRDARILDFLRTKSILLSNLRPSQEGSANLWRLTIPLNSFDQSHTFFTIVAVDEDQVAEFRLPTGFTKTASESSVTNGGLNHAGESTYVDLRHTRAVNSSDLVVTTELTTVLQPGELLQIDNWRSATVETYASLADVYKLFSALLPEKDVTVLNEFAFLLEWPTLNEEVKRAAFEKYSSHELHVFLHRKDPAFFESVVRPVISNKLVLSLWDRILLGLETPLSSLSIERSAPVWYNKSCLRWGHTMKRPLLRRICSTTSWPKLQRGHL